MKVFLISCCSVMLVLAVLSTGVFSQRLIYPIHTLYAVTTSSTVALAARDGRRWLLVQNDSDTNIYCRLDGGTAVVGGGIRFENGGANLLLSNVIMEAAITCIHGGAATKDILFTDSR